MFAKHLYTDRGQLMIQRNGAAVSSVAVLCLDPALNLVQAAIPPSWGSSVTRISLSGNASTPNPVQLDRPVFPGLDYRNRPIIFSTFR